MDTVKATSWISWIFWDADRKIITQRLFLAQRVYVLTYLLTYLLTWLNADGIRCSRSFSRASKHIVQSAI